MFFSIDLVNNKTCFSRSASAPFLLVISTIVLLAGCGSGGGGGENPVSGNTTKPGVTITFPPQHSLTKAGDVTVRGTATNPEGTLSSVSLNGVVVNMDSQTDNWSSNVNLTAGINTLSVSATYTSGDIVTDEVQIKFQPALLDRPNSIVYDSENDRLLAISNPLGSYNESALVAIDISTGVQTVISNNTIPNDTNPFENPGPSSLVLDSVGNRVLLKQGNQIMAIDLASGNRTILSGEGIPDSVNPFTSPRTIAIDQANNRLLVADLVSTSTWETSIIAVDLSSGERSILSNGTYPNELNRFGVPHHIEIDSDNNRALISWAGGLPGGGITAVDLTTGARTVVSNNLVPDASNLPNFSSSIALDKTNNRIILADSRNFALFAIDATTGARTVLLDTDSVADNILLSSPEDLAIDQSGNRLFILDSRMKSVTMFDFTTKELSNVASSRFHEAVNDNAGVGKIAFDAINDRIVSATNTAEGKTAIFSMDGNGGERTLIAEEESPYNTYYTVEYDGENESAYVYEGFSKAIYAIDLSTGNRTMVSGSGVPDKTNLTQYVRQMALDSTNNRLFACDINAMSIWSIDLVTGARSIISDNTTPDTSNPFSQPFYIEYDQDKNRLLVLDRLLGSIISVDVDSGVRTVLWDSETGLASIVLKDPRAFAYDAINNHVFVLDITLDAIIDIDLSTGQSTVLSDNSTPNSNNPFSQSTGIALDTINNRLLVSDRGSNVVLEVDLTTGERSVISNTDIAGSEYSTSFSSSERIDYDPDNNRILMVGGSINDLVAIDISNGQITAISNPTSLSVPQSVDIDTQNNRAIVVSQRNNAVATVNLTSGEYSLLSERYAYRIPYDVTVNPTTNEAYIIDNIDDKVISTDLVSGVSSVLSGPTVPDTTNVFSSPQSIAMDAIGQRVLVVANKKIYSIDIPTGARTILSDETVPNSENMFVSPGDMVVDTENNRALVIDKGLEAVISVDLTTGERSIVSDSNTPNANNPITDYGVYGIQSITFDSIRNRLLLNRGEGIIAVDLINGQRVYLLSR